MAAVTQICGPLKPSKKDATFGNNGAQYKTNAFSIGPCKHSDMTAHLSNDHLSSASTVAGPKMHNLLKTVVDSCNINIYIRNWSTSHATAISLDGRKKVQLRIRNSLLPILHKYRVVSLLRDTALQGISPYPGNPLHKETASGRKRPRKIRAACHQKPLVMGNRRW